ncbi:unnamed protein product [Microthlaspi erraticum]|uniref:Arabidopsis retrotransposon Orf1 C-terminal domain-containing protein n=1 Tax=Microthlaspi erraticum TaxID=1685480 RepID=A0A6D2IV15_9BRAS|nr:unnamed protein product [Microthlaspi erraticum]
MYQEHYDALFSMDFMDTKYPHVDTMKALGIFEMWSWSSRTCTWPSSSLPHGILQGAHLRVPSFNEGEKRMVTFRQLEILFGFNYGEGTKWNFKEKELQRVWATIADGVYSSSRSKAAQIRSPVLRYLLTYKITAYNTRHQRGRKLSVGGLITPILCAAGVNPTDRELLNQVGWTSSFARPTSSLSTRSWMGGSNSSSHIHWLDPPSFLLPNPELTTVVRGENIDFRPPVYTLVGHEDDCEKRSLSSIELSRADRAEDRAEIRSRER